MSLMNKILEPTKGYISFRDLLFRLSSLNNEPLHVVVTYLLHHDLDGVAFYNIDTDYKIIRFAPYEFDTVREFLKEIQSALNFSDEEWVWSTPMSPNELRGPEIRALTDTVLKAMHCFFKKSDLLSFKPLHGLLHFEDLEIDVENVPIVEQLNNNSLASYMTEYTLPQAVALILHIDLADITTNSSNSYIHEQDKYNESTYTKFNNLLQSYSIAALNNKIDGADVHTRLVIPFGGGQEVHVNLEKTSISRGKLASYLTSIGYQLDDLIAKQDPVHAQYSQYDGFQQDDSELVSNLQQQVADLQARVDEKTEELKDKSAKLDLAQNKIKGLDKPASNDKQLSDNTANDYQVTIGMLLELLRTSKGCDKEGSPNKPLFSTQTSIVVAITKQFILNHAETKVSERFTASARALAEAKKNRDSDLEEKAALAEKLKRKAALSA